MDTSTTDDLPSEDLADAMVLGNTFPLPGSPEDDEEA